jgi:hypothetical protein
MKFKNKADLIDFLDCQLGVKLSNEPSCLNDRRKSLYTEINRTDRNKVLRYLNKLGISHEPHVKDFYWINF